MPLTDSSPGTAQSTFDTRLLGVALVVLSVASAAGFIILSSAFSFPGILREGGDKVLPLYAEKVSIVKPTYWMLGMTGLLLIGCAVELGRLLAPSAPGPARLVSAFGVATGAFWSLGYTRWPIAVPYLSEQYASGEKKAAVGLYEVLNRYAGMTVGEHLGFITMGVFGVALAIGLRRAGIGPKWHFGVGVFASVLIAITAYEQYNPDAEIFGALNGAANTIWFLWILAIGIVLVRRSGGAVSVDRGPSK